MPTTARSWQRACAVGGRGCAEAGQNRDRHRRRRRAFKVEFRLLRSRAHRRAERTDKPSAHLAGPTRDAQAFPGIYEEMKVMFGARTAASGRPRGMVGARLHRADQVHRSGRGQGRHRELKARSAASPTGEAFITAISPTNLEMYFPNEFYRSDEEYLAALGRRDERGIPGDRRCGLPGADRRPPADHALQPRAGDDARGEPQVHRAAGRGGEPLAERHSRGEVRFHTCYSVNVAPRVHDLELRALRGPDAQDQGAGLFDRSREPAA